MVEWPPSAKTAVIGASGYVGRHLWKGYREAFPDVLGTTFSTRDRSLVAFDIREPDIRALGVTDGGYVSVLIASAQPRIGFCDEHPDEAYAVNVRGTLELVRQVAQTSMQVIFLSSDYVFEGSRGAYADDDPVAPTTEYGRQKAAVEQAIPELADNYLILRLSKIYGTPSRDGTLLDEIATSLSAGQQVLAASDQIFCPTMVDDLVGVIFTLQARDVRGIVNVCAPNALSRYDIAARLATALGADPRLVQKVSLHDLPGLGDRPLNTSMVCPRLAAAVGPLDFMPIDEAITRVARARTGRRS